MSENLPTILTVRFRDALDLAVRLHAGQYRKGSPVPYISHLMAVSSIVLEAGGSEDEAIAALLHDAVEDQGGAPTLALIRQQFGEQVAFIVDGCSDADTLPKPTWRPRKEAYLAHLRDTSASVRLVSLADKIHNARSILMDYRQLGPALWDLFKGGRQGTLWYYHELVEIFNVTGPFPLSEELERIVRNLETLVAQTEGDEELP